MQKYKSILVLVIALLFSVKISAQKDTTRSLDPADDLYKAGLKLMDTLEYKKAIKKFEGALKINKELPQCYNKMAKCKLELKDYKGAEKDMNMSLKLAPDNAEGLKLLGRILFLEQKYADAKKNYDASKKINLEDPELHFYIAELQVVGKDVKGAISSLMFSIDVNENYKQSYLLLGKLRFEQKDYLKAIVDLSKYIAKYNATTKAVDKPVPGKEGETKSVVPPSFEAHELRAKTRFAAGDFKGAIEDYNIVLEIDNKNENAYTYRGAAKIETNDNSGAVADLDEAIKINKKSHIAYNFRGVAKSGLKSYQAAIEDLDYSIKLKFDYASAYVNRAAAKFTVKDKKGACDDLNKAEQLGSEYAIKLIQQYCK